jgi:hypothetical protein
VERLIDKSWTKFGRKKVWDTLDEDEDLNKWTTERLKLEEEDHVRRQEEEV